MEPTQYTTSGKKLTERESQTGPDPVNPTAVECVMDTDDWRTNVRSSMQEIEQPDLIPRVIWMLEKHADTWSGALGEIAATTHRIQLHPEAKPTRRAPYRAGHASRELITKQIDKMRDAGVIEPTQSEWASPVVIVIKKDGSPRFCVDYRKLNAVTIPD